MSSSKLVNLAVLTTDLRALAVALAISSGPHTVPLLSWSASSVSVLMLAFSLMDCSSGIAVVMLSLLEGVNGREESSTTRKKEPRTSAQAISTLSSSSLPPRSLSQMTSRRKSLFRPCIDLHQGVVKQIVGASLRDDDEAKDRALASSSASASRPSSLKTNFTSTLSPAHYASLYRSNNLIGGHVIKLGSGNEEAAEGAVTAWKDGLHVGGGINIDNAKGWIERGAEKVSR